MHLQQLALLISFKFTTLLLLHARYDVRTQSDMIWWCGALPTSAASHISFLPCEFRRDDGDIFVSVRQKSCHSRLWTRVFVRSDRSVGLGRYPDRWTERFLSVGRISARVQSTRNSLETYVRLGRMCRPHGLASPHDSRYLATAYKTHTRREISRYRTESRSRTYVSLNRGKMFLPTGHLTYAKDEAEV
jgi:hypothetical protein